jgi:hypothetical protein
MESQVLKEVSKSSAYRMFYLPEKSKESPENDMCPEAGEIGEAERPGVTNGCTQESGSSKHQSPFLCSLCQCFHPVVSSEV